MPCRLGMQGRGREGLVVIDPNNHFSRISDKYRDLRRTDLEPILYIKRRLERLPKIEAADVGCGAGRYALQLFKLRGDGLYLNCFDANREMLNQLKDYLTMHKINNFRIKETCAEKIPLEDSSLDCMFTFNAVHHFKLLGFLKEASRVLKDSGYLFIYTRLRSQSSRNIWGKYFPLFNQKETRLYELDEFKEIARGVPTLKLESVEYFEYKRNSGLGRLEWQAQNHHYSTFDLYTEQEFSRSFEKFRQNLRRNFEDPKNIQWSDENILMVLRKH